MFTKKKWVIVLLALVTSTGWAQLQQQAYIKASNSGESDRFGWDLALEGDTLVVGAAIEESAATGINGDQSDDSLWDAGAVYVFTDVEGEWRQQAYIKASNTDDNDNFGESVDISGDTLVVGAPRESSAASGVNGDQHNDRMLYSGAAYVFVREGETWRQQAYLKASNSGNPDYFGRSVAVHGDTIVVGAPGESSNAQGINGNQDDNSSRAAGAAYVFTRAGETWSQQAYLKASDTKSMNGDWSYDEFGKSVDIYDDTIAVGAIGAMSVYVFTRNVGEWKQQALIKASNTDIAYSFGCSVSVHEDQIVVGAEGERGGGSGVDADQSDDSLTSAGAAYVFTRNGEDWSQDAYLKASNPDSWDRFGSSVSINGDAVLVGAWGESSIATGINGNQDDDSAHQAGAAYLFRRDQGVWYQSEYIKASNTWLDLFGESVSVSGQRLAVGASLEASDADGVNGDQTDNSARGAGAVYQFEDLKLNAPSLINPGFNDAWYNPHTSGQGFLISVFPSTKQMFVAWFTYDTERPPDDVEAVLGEPGHRWLTAQGPYAGDTASLTIYVTEGGVFDAADPPANNDGVGDGTMTIEFSDCTQGLVTYEISSPGLFGEIPIQRITDDNVALCEALAAN